MSRGIRWVPAKSNGLGQALPAPAPTPQPVNDKGQAVMNGIVYGGLVLAGLAFLWAITMSATPDSD